MQYWGYIYTKKKFSYFSENLGILCILWQPSLKRDSQREGQGVVEINGAEGCQLTKIRPYCWGKGESFGVSEKNSDMIRFVFQEDESSWER